MIVMGVFFFILALTAFRAASRPHRFWYGLTGSRVLLLGSNGALETYSGSAFLITQITMLPPADENRGTLAFDYGPDGEGQPRYLHEFIGIRDPARVEALIRETLLEKNQEGVTG